MISFLLFISLIIVLQVLIKSANADAVKTITLTEEEFDGVNADSSGIDLLTADQEEAAKASGEKHAFGAEVNKLMQIIINSLYTNNEVFLRELISNASDALDKIRFLSLTDQSQLGEGEQAKLEIKIKGDADANTLTLTDRGVGMTKADLVANLGTIAQSGTKDFLQKFQEYSDSNLIGQFGVGFYSVFLVADSVTVVTKHNDDATQWVWQSTADGSFTISADPRGNTLGRGTQIVIHLKEDATEYAQVATLKRLVAKYSEFITFPISVWASHEESEEVPMNEEELAEQLHLEEEEAAAEAEDDDAEEEESVDLDDEDKDDADEADDAPKMPKKTTKTEYKTVWDWEVLNDVKPLWTRSSDEVSEDEYKEFFKSALKQHADPVKWSHFSAEGEIEFKALLYVPGSPPPGMFDGTQKRDNMKLFVRRVFITDDFSDILPKYLSFIFGLVDSDDLPLNVSREQLQQHKTLKIIKKKLIRKAIAMFQELAQAGGDEWDNFYKAFNTNLKLGVIEDASNRSRLSKLLMFLSSTQGELTTLNDYVERMVKDQDQVYYLAGQSKEELEVSPLLERFQSRGIEVLLLTDPIDEYVTQNMAKFDGKYTLTNIGKEGVKLPGDTDDQFITSDAKETFKPLTDWLKENLDGVSKVVLSKRLTKSPAALVSGSYGYSANMARIVKAQALADPSSRSGYMFGAGQQTLEINPRHPSIKRLLEHVEADTVSDEDRAVATLIYSTARLTSGFDIDDKVAFADAINTFIEKSLDVQGEQVELFEEEEDQKAADEEEEEEEDDWEEEWRRHF